MSEHERSAITEWAYTTASERGRCASELLRFSAEAVSQGDLDVAGALFYCADLLDRDIPGRRRGSEHGHE